MLNTRWLKSVFVQDQLRQLRSDLFADSVFDGAAALAYYLTLAIFPGLIFAFTLLPYLSLPGLNSLVTSDIFNYLPSRAAVTLQSTLMQVLREPKAGLMSVSFLGGLIAASSGLAAMMRQMNIAYDVRETRSLFHTRAVAVLMTLLLTLVLFSALGIIVVGDLLISDTFLKILRWLVVLATVYTGLSIIYFIAPNNARLQRPYRYFSPGGWLATFLILISTSLMGVYISYFDSYNKVYGSLAGIIILMVWFYLVGFAILMGAQLNHFFYEKRVYSAFIPKKN
jgi:membrane protein